MPTQQNITGLRVVKNGQKSEILNLSNARRKTYAELQQLSAAQKKGVIICPDYPLDDGDLIPATAVKYRNTTVDAKLTELNADITTVTDELLEVGSDKIRFKRKGNKVSFYGALSNLGSATQVDFGTLPSSHRPISGYQIFACYHPSLPHEATGSIWISDAGVVTIYKPASPTGLYVSGNYVSN